MDFRCSSCRAEAVACSRVHDERCKVRPETAIEDHIDIRFCNTDSTTSLFGLWTRDLVPALIDVLWTGRSDYAPKFFEDIVPSAELTLEIGCGEGRVSRDLRDGGHDVIAIDASPTLLQHAADATLSPLISSPMRRHFHFVLALRSRQQRACNCN
jgi:SAM-dependent methyltransferase